MPWPMLSTTHDASRDKTAYLPKLARLVANANTPTSKFHSMGSLTWLGAFNLYSSNRSMDRL
eukprot:8255230-Lingulodinium_polyedra.AAC.1